MLAQVNRLKTSRDFDNAYKGGAHFKGDFGKLIVFDRSDKDPFRLGVVISAKRGNAVQRNRAKRKIREVVRNVSRQIKEGVDIIYIVWDGTFSYTEMEKEIAELMKRARVLS